MRWNALAQGKTSDQLVDILLEDLGASLLREKDTFVALVQLNCLLHPERLFLNVFPSSVLASRRARKVKRIGRVLIQPAPGSVSI